MLYTVQPLFCQACGKKFPYTVQSSWHGRACCYVCWQEIQWKEILSNMGKEYYEDPRKDEHKKSYMQKEPIHVE